MQAVTPTGAAAITVTVPAGAFPAAPGSTACTGTSAEVCPAGMLPSWVVTKRASPAVMHTVPSGMVWAVPLSPVKRTVPAAFRAPFRSIPRMAAWSSRYSPAAVWGKACRLTQSACT